MMMMMHDESSGLGLSSQPQFSELTKRLLHRTYATVGEAKARLAPWRERVGKKQGEMCEKMERGMAETRKSKQGEVCVKVERGKAEMRKSESAQKGKPWEIARMKTPRDGRKLDVSNLIWVAPKGKSPGRTERRKGMLRIEDLEEDKDGCRSSARRSRSEERLQCRVKTKGDKSRIAHCGLVVVEGSNVTSAEVGTETTSASKQGLVEDILPVAVGGEIDDGCSSLSQVEESEVAVKDEVVNEESSVDFTREVSSTESQLAGVTHSSEKNWGDILAFFDSGKFVPNEKLEQELWSVTRPLTSTKEALEESAQRLDELAELERKVHEQHRLLSITWGGGGDSSNFKEM